VIGCWRLAFSRWLLATAKEKFEMKQIRAIFIIRLISAICGQGTQKFGCWRLAFSRWLLATAKEKFEMKQIRATFIIRLIRVIRGQTIKQ
jgi:hypothetical protein